jgi:hypothetical protein
LALQYLVNDPEHLPRHAPWLRGITPLRLACFIVVCMTLAARNAFANGVPDVLAGLSTLQRVTRYFIVFGLPLFVLVIKCDLWTAHAGRMQRVSWFAVAILAGSAVMFTMPYFFLPSDTRGLWQWQVGYFMRGALLGSLMAAILYFARRESDALREMYRERIAGVDADRRAGASRLHALNAQIEPHFLFNCLASVKRLYERDAGNGRAMLRNLLTYVRTASARAGTPQSRLGDEIALARAFLDIFQVRMGARLNVRIDVPAHLEDAVVPSLAIGTLVENAIKHGIGPRAAGGMVGISARLDDSTLIVDVVDDGVGFRARSGQGIGLANIRAQLEEVFQANAALDLSANPGGGVTASMSLPWRLA